MTQYTLPYGNVLAVRIMIVVILLFVTAFCAYLISKIIYTAEQSAEGNIEIITGIVGIIGSLILSIIFIVTGVL